MENRHRAVQNVRVLRRAMFRMLMVAVASASFLAAEITNFADVRHDYVPSESGKVEKTDGMLHLDTAERIVSFSSDNRVLIHIRYEQVREVVYERGNDHLLTIYFRTGGLRDASRFRLRGSNRSEILRRLNTQLPDDVLRTGF
jgi:hypothetical protein